MSDRENQEPPIDQNLKNVKRELAGRVSVDVGRIIICDPAYMVWQRLSERDDELMEGFLQAAARSEGLPPQAYKIPFTLGHEGAAVVVHSGLGDGFYPVYITTAEVGNYGNRVVRVEVDFLDHLWLETVPLELPDAMGKLLTEMQAWMVEAGLDEGEGPGQRLLGRLNRTLESYKTEGGAQ